LARSDSSRFWTNRCSMPSMSRRSSHRSRRLRATAPSTTTTTASDRVTSSSPMLATMLPGSWSSPPVTSGNAVARDDGTGPWLSRCMEWVLALS
jgi:hypothetical protein